MADRDREPDRDRDRRRERGRDTGPVAISEIRRQGPVEEGPRTPRDVPAVYSTGKGPAEQYHYHRQPSYTEQVAIEMQGETGEVSPV